MTAKEIIALLGLQPHPEGGHYTQTWAADGPGRAAGTCIYFLLRAKENSAWHRVDATEIWHYYAGAPIRLTVANDPRVDVTHHMLGPDLASGARPQVIVPQDCWQAARTTGDWTLVGCTVSPGFSFSGFTLATPEMAFPEV